MLGNFQKGDSQEKSAKCFEMLYSQHTVLRIRNSHTCAIQAFAHHSEGGIWKVEGGIRSRAISQQNPNVSHLYFEI